jgi:hypothetical protein
MHAEAIIFDFVKPLVAIRRRLHELRQLRTDPLRQSGGTAARPARYRPRHAGNKKRLLRGRMRLFEMIDLGYVLRRMYELERDDLAMPASREAPSLITVTSCGMSACGGSCLMM